MKIMNLPTIICLIPMIVSDFRHRLVSVYWLLAFGAIQLVYGDLDDMIVNLLVLLFMLCGSWIYFYLRHKIQLIRALGIGDILFLLFMTPCFSFSEFLSFLILGFLLSLFWWFMDHTHTIPLVTTFGLLLLIRYL